MYLLYILALAIVLVYAILKEREELGCYKFSIEKQCNDNESVYVSGTKMDENDTDEILYKKLENILSYHEKGGVWKRCFILATILVLFVFLFDRAFKDNNLKWIVIHMNFFTVLYFYFNYLNYHHFRNLKKNGLEIIQRVHQGATSS